MTGRLLYDLTGLVHWYAYFRRPGGVQRVIEQVALCDVIRRSPAVEFVVRILGSDRFFRMDRASLGDLDALRRVHARGLRRASLAGVLSEGRYFHLPYLARGWLLESGASLEIAPPPGAGDTLFNPGDLWWQKRYADRVAGLKNRTGVRLVQMIHDLYLIERPEWTPAAEVRVFADQLTAIAPVVDRWLVNSQFMKDKVEDYLAQRSLPAKPVSILPMGWDSFATAGASKPGVEPPYILFVGTVEPRKNLPALLDAMVELRARLRERVPQLVVVGGPGWKAGDVTARLTREAREGRVVWLKNVPDAELARLYRDARFTVMPSRGEGFGLAVQESIAQGVPCIASVAGGTREASGDLASYFDPTQPGDLTRAMAAWIVDDAALADARAKIARALSTGQFATWNDAGKLLLSLA
ncbi:MAG TPA: glycosyltransferase family 1 protein [Reyranella sp.]|nr:glycosyltransferase family 1 protein [Reyranella sp.]